MNLLSGLPAQPPAPDDLPVAERGRLRAGKASVTLDRPLPAGMKLGLRVEYRSAEGGSEQFLWPQAASLPETTEFTFDINPPPDGNGQPLLLRGLLPVASGGGDRPMLLRNAMLYGLDNLLPLTPKESLSLIFHKGTRYRDVPTLMFVLGQIMRSPLNGALEKVEAAKIFAFRVMENAAADQYEEALRHLDAALAQGGTLKKEYGVGKDTRYHARTSLWFVKACLLFLTGDVAACVQALEGMRLQTKHLDKCPTAANNIALGLTTLGYIHLLRGDREKALDVWDDVVRVFRAAAFHYPTGNPKVFNEIVVSFGAAKYCVAATRAVQKGDPALQPELKPKHVSQHFFRLGQSAGARQVERLFETLGPSCRGASTLL